MKNSNALIGSFLGLEGINQNNKHYYLLNGESFNPDTNWEHLRYASEKLELDVYTSSIEDAYENLVKEIVEWKNQRRKIK